MAVTTTLIAAGPNHLRYLMSAAGAETGTLTCSGAASPDIQTDSPAGQIHKISRTFDEGYGKLAAGALNQAKARALLLSDDAANVVGTGVPRAITTACPRTAFTATLTVDANVDGNGEPVIEVAFSGAGACYLDIHMPGGIGQ